MIDAMRKSLETRSYPGYPTERLVIEAIDTPSNPTLPDGPWTTSVNVFPSLDEQEQFHAQGIEVDEHGRPLHPWLHDMLHDPDIGVVTGMGKYWYWGPNHAADPIIMTNDEVPKILLIKRSDSGIWALSGGFVDPGETPVSAAKRELFEEAGLLLIGDEGRHIYTGVIGDLRSTAHAWGETTATLWKIPTEVPVEAGDDALDAGWFEVTNLPEPISNQHLVIIKRALADIALIDTTAVAIPFPVERRTYTKAHGGHMSYQRIVIHNRDGSKRFLKSHDNSAFTEPSRAENSLMYLQKEKFVYDHLRPHVPELSPESVRIIDNHSLMMEALTPEDGWLWRAPKINTERYIDEIIAGLSILQSVPIPNDEHIPIEPTYPTLAREGWNVIGEEKTMQRVEQKIFEMIPKMNPRFQKVAKRLARDLHGLELEYEELEDPDEFFFSHHDIRQANIAWHPALGTKVVDWSWAGPGRKDSDITTLLIDLHKSGHNVHQQMAYFNPDHALTMIGFWLGHSLWPTKTEDQSVRFHQVASAVSAYDLLMKYRKRRFHPVPTKP